MVQRMCPILILPAILVSRSMGRIWSTLVIHIKQDLLDMEIIKLVPIQLLNETRPMPEVLPPELIQILDEQLLDWLHWLPLLSEQVIWPAPLLLVEPLQVLVQFWVKQKPVWQQPMPCNWPHKEQAKNKLPQLLHKVIVLMLPLQQLWPTWPQPLLPKLV